MKAGATQNLERIQAAIVVAGKRAAIADSVGVSEGQLSKMMSGELRRFCQILDEIGLEVFPREYVESLRHIVREELNKGVGNGR